MVKLELETARQTLEDGLGRAYPGCQAWVARNGEVVLDISLGMAQMVPEGRPVTPDTKFDLASVTKAIGTTVVAMRLHASGDLDLNRRVVSDLGHFPYPPFLEQATYQDLLLHCSGFQSYDTLFERFNAKAMPLPGQARTALAAQISSLPRAYATRSKCEYSDFGFMYLGWALERVTGLPLPALFASHVAAPLNLAGLCTSATDESIVDGAAATERCPWRQKVIVGEVHDEHAYLLGGCAGHAGLFGTARAVGAVGQALLDAYHGRRETFLPAATVRRFWDPANQLSGETRRLGFDGASLEGSMAGLHTTRSTVGHLGFTGTSLWIYPEQEAVIVLLSNRVHPTRSNEEIRATRQAFHTAVMDAFVNVQPHLI